MNLLTDPLLRCRTARGIENMTLPALLARLGRDEINSYPGLQRHQEDPWHMFLCQLGALVMARHNSVDPVQDEGFWRSALRALAGRDDDLAWTLVVPDVAQPAFMQPPLTGALPGKLKPAAETPDALDVLPTAKNHDVKRARGLSGTPDEWVYALVDLQTTAGFFGRGNYGIARMNGGFSSRPCVELVNAGTPGGRWLRVVRRLMERRPALLAPPWPYRADGHGLLWLLPWDGRTSLALDTLDPWFIEVARVARLSADDGRLHARGAPTQCARIEAKAQNGVLGDPWVPVDLKDKEPKALTVAEGGFTPQLLHGILFEDGYEGAWLQYAADDEIGRDTQFHASVFVRGQGTTDGFHAVDIPIPQRASFALFGGGEARQGLAETSRLLLEDAAAMQNKVMTPALFTMLEGGPDSIDFDKTEVSAWVEKVRQPFITYWHGHFFDWLWDSLDFNDRDQARLRWLEAMEHAGRHTLERAFERLPRHSDRNWRSRVKALDRYQGALYKHFPQLKEARHARRIA